MPLMDEFKEEREEMKNRSFKEKAAYFWDYYKWHVIGTAIGIVIVASLLHSFLTRKEVAYYSMFINMVESTYSQDYKKGFAEEAGINLKKQAVYFDADMLIDFQKMDEITATSLQKIMVYLAAGDLDSMLGNLETTNQYAYNGVFTDLREFLTKEEFEKYEPYFFYADKALIDSSAGEITIGTKFPGSPTDPSSMEDPIPVAIRLDQCTKLKESYAMGTDQYVAFLVNSEHPELNHVFLNYLFEN